MTEPRRATRTERHGYRCLSCSDRLLRMCVAGVALALALPAPAIASDEVVSALSLLDQTAPPSPEPTVELPGGVDDADVAEALEDAQLSIGDASTTVAVKQDADGGLDVSVRVDDDGAEAASAGQTAQTVTISDVAGADITSGGAAAAGSAAEADGGLDAVPTSTTVSVRVLSPDDVEPTTGESVAGAASGPAGDDGAGADDPEDPGPAGTPPGTGDPDVRDSASEAPRYHDSDSQYQFPEVSSEETWIWEWYLTLDCAGQVSSDSRETGSYTSSDWMWNWVWSWGCETVPDAASAPADDTTSATSRDPPAQGGDEDAEIASTPASGTSSSLPTSGQSATSDQSEGSPAWAWTWTFTFCGTTTTITTQVPGDALLAWAWSWAWTWACASVPDAPAPAAGDEPPAYSPPEQAPRADDAAPAGPPPQPPLSQPLPALASEVISALPPFPASISPTPLDVTIIVPLPVSVAPPGDITFTTPLATGGTPEILSPDVPLLGEPGSGEAARAPLGPGPTTPPAQQVAPAGMQEPSPASASGSTRPAGGSSTATSPRPEASPAPRARPAPPRSPDRLPPAGRLLATLGGTGSSSASSGAAPSGSVLVVAVLTGLFVLAAPGIGRRIRVARELSPRSPGGPPIDDPG